MSSCLQHFHLLQLHLLHLQDPPYKLEANIKRPEGFHRTLKPLWKRRVSSSIFSLSTDALKAWGFCQKWNWGVTKEQLQGHSHSNPCVGFWVTSKLIITSKWIIRYIFSLPWCPSAPSLSLSDYYSYAPQEQRIFLSSLHSFDSPQIPTLPCTPGSWGTEQGARRAPQGSGTNPRAALGTGGDGLGSATEGDEPKDWQGDPRNSFCSGNCFWQRNTLCPPQERTSSSENPLLQTCLGQHPCCWIRGTWAHQTGWDIVQWNREMILK